jgi:hypothetical protein
MTATATRGKALAASSTKIASQSCPASVGHSFPAMFPLRLRRFWAVFQSRTRENPKVVGERLGQAGVALTLDTYSHVLPDMQQAAAENLEN